MAEETKKTQKKQKTQKKERVVTHAIYRTIGALLALVSMVVAIYFLYMAAGGEEYSRGMAYPAGFAGILGALVYFFSDLKVRSLTRAQEKDKKKKVRRWKLRALFLLIALMFVAYLVFMVHN